ncbi:Ribose 5-phosphate isomerase B [Alteracholeplasma palmae J233]|uniref:Ribose 5-phosphate isomerase B n=1 Tax=Alteracholeplasma palmae (strain ATCC 49389 / J233) TaxID=1318466 RepID=U4KQM1_ALTPJ|nr:ribose 5-phosphate isomerase B [Alteracholeplasma palmae]CCV64820.1 Ribose 5-phosphate isomerase B [Alteracholeplasma palmae J233]
MKIALGSDHAGFKLKEELKTYLSSKKIEVLDLGTNSEDSVDYPDYGKKVGHAVVEKSADLGIVVCGTGIGISIAANKVKGVRAALVYDELTGKLAKEHNNANVIALGGRTTSTKDAYKIVDAFLNATFEQRHQKRLDKLEEEEN